jgi:hypothetical protein
MIKPSPDLWLWPVGGIVVLLLTVGLAYWQLRVTQVECLIQASSPQACPEELSALLQPFYGQPLIATNFEHNLANLVNEHRSPYELLAVTKQMPGTLRLQLRQDPFQYHFQERGPTPQAWLVTEHGWLRASDGTPSAQLKIPTITRLTPVLAATPDARQIDTSTHDLINQLLPALKLYDIEYQEIVLYDPVTTVIKLNDTQQVLIENDKLLENLEKLDLILSHPPQLNSPAPIVEYDVRFRLPVLRTQVSISVF